MNQLTLLDLIYRVRAECSGDLDVLFEKLALAGELKRMSILVHDSDGHCRQQ